MTDLQKAESYIESHLSGNRISHVYSVCDTATKMCRLLGKTEYCKAAYTAALLHDITKEFSNERHLEIIEKNSIQLTEDDFRSPEILHSFTGAAFAKELLPELINDEIYGAIFNHTTGKKDMTFLEKVIFLSDYIEPKRKYDASHELYDYFMNNIGEKNILEKACLICLTNMVEYLEKNGSHVNSRTIFAKEFLEERLG